MLRLTRHNGPELGVALNESFEFLVGPVRKLVGLANFVAVDEHALLFAKYRSMSSLAWLLALGSGAATGSDSPAGILRGRYGKLTKLTPATHFPNHQSMRFCSAVLQFCTSRGNHVLSAYPYSL
jgi:hypothetical protein